MSALIPPTTNTQATSSTPTTPHQQPQQKHGNTLTPPTSSSASGAATITKSSPMTSLRSSENAPNSNSMMHRNSSFAGSSYGMIPSSPYAQSHHSSSNNNNSNRNHNFTLPGNLPNSFGTVGSGLPDPCSVQKQKDTYIKLLDAQLAQGIQALDIQLKQHREAIMSQADAQKKAFNMQVDMEVKAQEMNLHQQYQEQHLQLQQSAQQQKASLEQQAMQLTIEYQQKQAEDEMSRQQYELERQQAELQRKLQTEFQSMQAQLSTTLPTPFSMAGESSDSSVSNFFNNPALGTLRFDQAEQNQGLRMSMNFGGNAGQYGGNKASMMQGDTLMNSSHSTGQGSNTLNMSTMSNQTPSGSRMGNSFQNGGGNGMTPCAISPPAGQSIAPGQNVFPHGQPHQLYVYGPNGELIPKEEAQGMELA